MIHDVLVNRDRLLLQVSEHVTTQSLGGQDTEERLDYVKLRCGRKREAGVSGEVLLRGSSIKTVGSRPFRWIAGEMRAL